MPALARRPASGLTENWPSPTGCNLYHRRWGLLSAQGCSASPQGWLLRLDELAVGSPAQPPQHRKMDAARWSFLVHSSLLTTLLSVGGNPGAGSGAGSGRHGRPRRQRSCGETGLWLEISSIHEDRAFSAVRGESTGARKSTQSLKEVFDRTRLDGSSSNVSNALRPPGLLLHDRPRAEISVRLQPP